MGFPTGFGVAALVLLFLKLPAVANVFGFVACAPCRLANPMIPLLGTAYFTAFITTILCFPTLPNRAVKYAGLVWAVAIAIVLTFFSCNRCLLCLSAHACHILMWIFWKPTQYQTALPLRIRFFLIIIATFTVTSFYSAMNTSFLSYG